VSQRLQDSRQRNATRLLIAGQEGKSLTCPACTRHVQGEFHVSNTTKQHYSRTSTSGNRTTTGGKTTTASEEKQQKDQLLTFEAGDTHHPPWFVNGLAWIGIGIGIGANVLQVYTSDIAFQTMIRANEVYKAMNMKGQAGAEPVIQLICLGIALIFQLGMLFFVFRIKQEYKNTRTEGIKGMEAIRHTAVNMIDHQKILLIWTIIAFVADTLGDYTFINLYVDDPFVIFMYAAALYAASTVLLSKALETQWAAAVAYRNWKSFKLYQKIQELKLANRADN